MVKFRCLRRGICCRKYWIPITHLDMFRLEYYGGIEVYEVVRLRDVTIYRTSKKYPQIIYKGKKYYLSLRDRPDYYGCIFLSDEGTCKVHEFKPLVCRFYPFVYTVHSDGRITIDVNENAIKECPGLILDGEPIDKEIEEQLIRLARIRIKELELYEEAVNEWNEEYSSANKSLSYLIDFLMDKAREHYKLLKKKGLWIK